MKKSIVQVLNKETCLVLPPALGTANPQLLLLTSKLPSEQETLVKTIRCPASGKLSSLFHKERNRLREVSYPARFTQPGGGRSGTVSLFTGLRGSNFLGVLCSLEGLQVLRQ